MKFQTADLDTGTAPVIGTNHLLKQQALARILADIMTSDFDDAFTIRAAVDTIRETVNATSTERRIHPDHIARL